MSQHVEIDNPSPRIEAKYRKILIKTLAPEFKEKLGGNETNYVYFTQGHYHDLVNDISNVYSIYWYENINDNEGE